MLPQNNYIPYQPIPSQPSQYTFDLKVNVDMASGKVGLGVPQNVQPFTRKPEVPVVYPNPNQSVLSGPNSYVSPSQAMVSSYPPVAVFPPPQTIPAN